MDNKITLKILHNNAPDKIIKTLSPYVTDPRKIRIESVISHRLESMTLAIESPSDINNALAAVRTAEALGISTVHIISPEHDAKNINSVTKSAFYWVNIICHLNLNDFLGLMKNEKKNIFGAIVNAEKKLSDIAIEKPLCILMGNEQRGLSTDARSACDYLFSIPMCGMLESLNLSVAAAISLYDVSQRKRTQLKNNSDLSEHSAQKLRAKYYLNSVNLRMAEQFLKV